MSDVDIAFKPIAELAAMLRAKQISSLELTQLYMARLQRLGPKLNALVTPMPERALREAKAADKDLSQGVDRGPLHGIPYGVKDLLAAQGAPTTWGATPYRHQYFDYDATAVQRLANGGAVLLGKLAMIELAGGMNYNQADASFTGPCKTPWSLQHWSGGSSSGSGSCVSAGLVAFALGSETSGSILNPSSYCGVTGLRPTYGRVSRFGAMPLSWTLDKVGPICRTAADTLTVLGVIAGRDPKDKTSVDVPSARLRRLTRTITRAPGRASASQVDAPRWRLGLLKGSTKKTQPEVKRNLEQALHTLGNQVTIETVELPNVPYDAMIGAIIAGEAASIFRELIEDGRVQTLTDPAGRHGGYSYLVINAVDYIDAMRQRVVLRQQFQKLFQKVDAIVAPTFATVAYPIDLTFDKVYPGTAETNLVEAGNLAGLPAISIPSGFGLHHLPTAMTFVGPPFSEADLVELGRLYQEQTRLYTRRPPFATV